MSLNEQTRDNENAKIKDEAIRRQKMSQDLTLKEVAKLTDSPGGKILTYGYDYLEGATQLEYEQLSFSQHLGLEKAGVTRLRNLKNIINITWPSTIFTPWMDRMLQSLCDYSFVSWAGCGASGKTHTAAVYSIAWWACDPLNSAVVMTSTTKDMIRRRMWAPLQNLYMNWGGSGRPGNLVDSSTKWQARKGDDKHSLSAMAVKDGNTQAAVAALQGMHPRRMLLVVDEATDCPQAIFDVVANLRTGCHEFQMLVIGNPNAKFDPHGKFSKPKNGWNSISINDHEWAIEDKFGQPGIMLRFDAKESPNMAYEEPKYPFLISRQQYLDAIKGLTENNPSFWKFYRGFWAPSGLIQTVLDETTITMVQGDRGFEWTQIIFTIAACDPAFGGGDRPTFRTATLGILESGKIGLELQLPEEIPLDAADELPIHYQLAYACRDKCINKGVPPQNFGMDATGEGGGTCDILAREWSPLIQRVEFGGAPSDLPVSVDDPREAKELYDRRVSELWFRFATYVKSGQVRGIDAETAIEFCMRTWELKGRKMKIQTKDEMKEAYGRSPDFADASVILVEVASRLGMFQAEGKAAEDMAKEKPEQEAYNVYEDEVGDEFEEYEGNEVYADS